jgi:hypothetical protein
MLAIRQEFGIKRLEEKKNLLELKSVLSGVSEHELRIARLSLRKTIAEYSLEGEEGLPVKVKILTVGICRDYAIRGVTDLETFRFLDILRKYYSGFTLDEIRTAFELALIGGLDEFLPKDRNGNPDKNSYQLFSLDFITKILSAYKKYKGIIWGKVYKCSEKEETPPTEEQIEEIQKDFHNTLQEQFNEYGETGILNILFPVFTAKYLIKHDKIIDREISEKDIQKATIILTEKLKEKKKKQNLFEGVEGLEGNKILAYAERIKSTELILELFEKLKNAGNNIWD